MAQSWSLTRNGERHVIACVLATHISKRERVHSLRSLLQSICKQDILRPELHVSWSSSPELESEVRDVFSAECKSGQQVYFQPKQLSQFQHYRFLANKLKDCEPPNTETWLLFSDDDDVWHPQRLHFYSLLLQTIEELDTQVVTCGWQAIRAGAADAGAKLPPVRRVEEVEAHLSSSKYFVEDLSGCQESTEYWMSLVRLDRTLAFFGLAPDGLVASTFCDVAFARFVPKAHEVVDGAEAAMRTYNVKYMPSLGMPWLYAYNASRNLDVEAGLLRSSTSATAVAEEENDHASSNAYEPTSAEVDMAAHMLPELKRRIPNALPYTVDALAEKLARDRRSLGVVVVTRLWVPSTVPIREYDGGPVVKAAERADQLAGMLLHDEMVIWKKHGLHPVEMAFNAYVLSVAMKAPVLASLRAFEIADAERIADRWHEQVVKLSDNLCRKAFGPSSVAPPAQRSSPADVKPRSAPSTPHAKKDPVQPATSPSKLAASPSTPLPAPANKQRIAAQTEEKVRPTGVGLWVPSTDGSIIRPQAYAREPCDRGGRGGTGDVLWSRVCAAPQGKAALPGAMPGCGASMSPACRRVANMSMWRDKRQPRASAVFCPAIGGNKRLAPAAAEQLLDALG